MKRVVVIGCAGSGESTLIRQLAGRTGLPLVERDELGEEGPPGYLSAIAEMAARPRWILDGDSCYADELVYSARRYRRLSRLFQGAGGVAGAAAQGGHRSAPPPGRRPPAAGSALRDREHPLRPRVAGSSQVRLLFVFDPSREAIILVAGDKAGQWNRWYVEAISLAEERYAAYRREQEES